MSSEASPPAPCVVCGKPQSERYKPFCSKRCADLDLHRWLTGGYAIPAVEEDLSSEGEGQEEDGAS